MIKNIKNILGGKNMTKIEIYKKIERDLDAISFDWMSGENTFVDAINDTQGTINFSLFGKNGYNTLKKAIRTFKYCKTYFKDDFDVEWYEDKIKEFTEILNKYPNELKEMKMKVYEKNLEWNYETAE